ncbi:type III-A CRISPR-associated RAMP protein Csm4 [Nitrosomonas communis]|uniref:CRISPR system Cms protein Csm4 n=1 Tax=Nitrosomonas communis TaxID=44574 RepID=A0A1I4RNI8_9PROT|nr:hypothetical protein [Nitrosomonas communis]SFM53540.1 CRISPR-associated protein Csm4 [Nitrosomonas communis]
MAHTLYRAHLWLHTALGTPLAGDTLFGQCCWTAREQLGEPELQRLLSGYTDSYPWLVVSDGFPTGFLPKPTLPQIFESVPSSDAKKDNPEMRKANKAKRWIPVEAVGKALRIMLMEAKSDEEAYIKKPVEAVQPHNTLNRLTGTTGVDEFAPHTQRQIFLAQNQRIDIYLVLDGSRMSIGTLQCLLAAIGMQGYGRDASIGLGKFSVEAIEPYCFATAVSSGKTTAFWTLAPCAPQGLGFDADNSYWRVITRFGRHGNTNALAASPFKNPVLLAGTGALFAADKPVNSLFIGQGLGGNGQLSLSQSATVQQGYAPVINLNTEYV